jgi:deoxyribonuclease (pyrimidine dimer)
MTRINLIHPQHLTKRHLIAEYRELKHVGHALQRSLKSGKPIEIPPTFRLNTGHVKFFYDKGLYLKKRYRLIVEDMLKRKIEVTEFNFNKELFPEGFYNDYKPTKEAFKIIIERISLRINSKPHLYKDKDIFFESLSEYLEG